MSAAEKAKKYMMAVALTYMCYLTQGVQGIILSQNKVDFYMQWGYTDPTAGSAAVSLAIVWVGVGKFVSVWAGGVLSDRIGRKIPAVIGGVLYAVAFIMMLTTDSFTVCCIAAFMTGLGTSGFWDPSLYSATQEASPRYAASLVIGIKAVISVAGIIYPIFAAVNSNAGNWHLNIWVAIVMSAICVVMAIFTPFVYDDEKKEHVSSGANSQTKADAEIQAAKDAMLQKPSALVNFCTMFYGFICMFIMYGAQQYTKMFGQTNAGLDNVAAAGLTSIYTVGSLVAVLFWAFMMAKLRWNPVKVVLIDSIITTIALAMVLLIHQVIIIYIAIAILGFGAAGGALQTGVIVRQNFHPGPKGSNIGVYYTWMGGASVFLPFIVSAMTTAIGEGAAVWTMMVLLLIAGIIATAMMGYLVSQSKKLFGYSAMEPMKD